MKRILGTLLLIASLLPTVASAALTDNLAAYYKFDANSNDSAGTNNGTDSNISYASAGIINNAADFNGSATSYMTLGSATALDDIWTSGGSVSMWVKIDTNEDNKRLLSKNANTAVGFQLSLRFSSGNKLEMQTFWSGADGAWTTTNNTAINTSTYTHICMVYDASSTANDPVIYINGSSVAITENVAPTGSYSSDASQNMEVGGYSTPDRNLDGKIDELAIWKGKLLSAAECSQLYNSGAGLAYPFTTTYDDILWFF